jgi:hypothetical protein
MTTGPTATGRFVAPSAVTAGFFTILAFWALFPLLIRGNFEQDALAYVVAGELVTSHPDQIYARDPHDLYALPPRFAERSCELSPPGTVCSNFNVAFVSPPQALPVSWLLVQGGSSLALLVYRFGASLCLAGGMWLLWKRLATRTPHASHLLLVSVLLLTPFATGPIALGQTSPLLFLSACLGVEGAARWPGATGRAVVWLLSIVFKLFPLALLPVLVVRRQWRLLAVAAAGTVLLTATSLVLGPTELYREFLHASSALNEFSHDNPYNGSLEVVIGRYWPATLDVPALVVASFVLRAGLALGLWWWSDIRRRGGDVEWAFAWLALLLFVPLVWWHYLLIVFAALGVALSSRRELDDRRVAVLPAAAALSLPLSLNDATGGAVPWAQALFLVAAVVAVAVVAREGEPASEPRSSATVATT